uniref:CSTF-50, ISOFORM B n=1 Tax=Drosophila melanogaster TaxID=7227 RepID=UPI0001F55033|nr:Chain A, Cstf-50, Isoform B [Drosophila melanogaster]
HMRDEILDPSNLVKNREILYRLMISQLMYDGLEKFAMELSMLVKADQCAPSERLLHVMIAGMQTLS